MSESRTVRVTCRWVDSATWADRGAVPVQDGTISRSSANLMQSADLTLSDWPDGIEHWLRVYAEVMAGGTTSRYPLFTGLASTPTRKADGTRITWSVEAYSVLKPADDVLLQRGSYAPVSTNAALYAKRLLSSIPAPVSIEGESPNLADSIVADDGETNLTMAQRVLDSVGWEIRVDGRGEVTIRKPESEPVASWRHGNDPLETSIIDETDAFDCPNVYRAVSGDSYSVARDETGAVYGIAARGREVWVEETGVSLGDGESLASYASRALAEAQAASRTVGYDRSFEPGVDVGDVIRLNYPAQGVSGLFRVTSQSISLSENCKVSEEASGL